jgi:RNA polymerase primary sigma factor
MTNTKRFIDTSEDSISKYLKDVRKIDMISAEEEGELAKLVSEGDQRATEKLVKSNLRFVISVAKEYQNQGLPLSDLISEGNFGLIKAASKFDPTRGFRFISYAVWWVKQAIIQSLNDHARTVRLPVNVTNNVSKLKKEMAKFEQTHGRKATVNDKLFDKDGKEFDMSILLHPTCGSLNEKINEDGDEVMDVIPDNSFIRPDEDIYTDEVLKSELEKTMSILSERERKIIEMYFGTDGSSMTLEQIGDEYGLTKERIRQIKEKALRKLKNNCDNLFDFMYK